MIEVLANIGIVLCLLLPLWALCVIARNERDDIDPRGRL